MHARIGHRHFRHATLQAIDLEIVLGSEGCEAIEVVVPEVVVVDQCMERLEQAACLFGMALLLEGFFQLLDQLLEADRVLLAFGKLR